MNDDYKDMVRSKGRLVTCKTCGYLIPINNAKCRKCGAKRPFNYRPIFILSVILLSSVLSCCLLTVFLVPHNTVPNNSNPMPNLGSKRMSDNELRIESDKLVRLFLADHVSSVATIQTNSIELNGPLIWTSGSCIVGGANITWIINYYNDGRINSLYLDNILLIGIRKTGSSPTYSSQSLGLTEHKHLLSSPSRDELYAYGVNVQ